MSQTISEFEQESDLQLLSVFLGKKSDKAERAFAQLVARHGSYVRAIARRRLGNSGLSDDATQQVFLLLAKKAKSLQSHSCLRAWLHRVSVYEAANLARKEKAYQKKKEHFQEDLSERADSRELSQLDEALAELPEKERNLLIQHYHEGWTFSEIGKRLGISEAAAQKRAHRALTKLSDWASRGKKSTSITACAGLLSALKSQGETLSSELTSTILGNCSLKTAAVPLSSLLLGVTLLVSAAGAGVVTYHNQQNAAREAHRAKVVNPRAEEPVAVATRSLSSRTFSQTEEEEELSPAVTQFIKLALEDEEAAFQFAKEQAGGTSRGLENFFGKAIEPLAERELDAAERLLVIVEAHRPRQRVFHGIFQTRSRQGFLDAVRWADGFARKQDRECVQYSGYSSSRFENYDYVAGLGVAKTPEVREWLLEQACERAVQENEEHLSLLADQLSGAERHLVLGYWASVLLQRGDPGAFELLDEARPNLKWIPDLVKSGRRDPEPLLDWFVLKKDGGRHYSSILNLVKNWGLNDAEAAADWWASVPNIQDHVSYRNPHSAPMVERILKQQAQ